MTAPPLAVSMGDPAGVGPEIIVKAWAARTEAGLSHPFCVFGDPDVMARAAQRAGVAAPVRAISAPAEAGALFADALPVIGSLLPYTETTGKADSAFAGAILGAIDSAVKAVCAGNAAALVTAPIAKAPLYAAGFSFPGHTEYLAKLTENIPLTGPRGPVMMLIAADLRVSLATIHLPLSQAPAKLDRDRVSHVARVTIAALKQDFGIAAPRLALAGLNPHAGEGGGLGREEIEIINPAAAALRAEGLIVTDAQPADALFHAEARKGYDAVLAMYHDQGLIPIKTLDFWGGVNVTLGLPIVRTSPDHGVAYDIAGKGMARPDSLIAALRMASAMSARRAAANA